MTDLDQIPTNDKIPSSDQKSQPLPINDTKNTSKEHMPVSKQKIPLL